MSLKSKIRQDLRTHPYMTLTVARIFSQLQSLRARFALIGRYRNAYIASDVRMIGISRIEIGKNVAIGRGSWLNVNDRKSSGVAISIGDNSFIGVHNFFTAGRSIVIRDYCLTAINCAFLGSAHRYEDPMRAYSSTGTTLDGDIYVGANCFFGVGATVLGSVRIGHGCILGAGTVVRSDIPPFSLVVGNPARVIKRFDFGEKKWVPWPADNLVEGPPEEEYIEHLRKEHGFVVHPISVVTSHFGDMF